VSSLDSDYKRAKIFAPKSWWDNPSKRTGGCGAGKLGDLFIPDTLWGLNVTFACSIHDMMYSMGLTEAARSEADRTLRNNLLRWIDYKTDSSVLKWLRNRRAVKYYMAVRMFGGSAFWNSKN
jgi:hypothetical protein